MWTSLNQLLSVWLNSRKSLITTFQKMRILETFVFWTPLLLILYRRKWPCPWYLILNSLNLLKKTVRKLRYQEVDLTSFWIHLNKEYPWLSDRAIKFLMPFATTYRCLCASGFSSVTATKSKVETVLKLTLWMLRCMWACLLSSLE